MEQMNAHGYGDILDREICESDTLQDLARPVGVGQSQRSRLPGRDPLWRAEDRCRGGSGRHDPLVAIEPLRGSER